MTNATLLIPRTPRHEQVSDILSAVSALLSGFALLLAIAVAF